MKLTAFEYYNQFYKSVLDEEEYEKSRLKIYRFLIDAAEDGVVPPAAQTVLSHLEEAERDIAAARLNGLTPAQRETFEALSGKVQESIQIVLQ